MVAQNLPSLVAEHDLQLVVANGENSAGGFGITPRIAEELFAMGIDVITSGNHVWDKKEISGYWEKEPRLLRPANYPPGVPGSGCIVIAARSGVRCAVVNLQGRVYMPATDCPFRKADEILAGLDPAVKVRLVDFHAEATSEKMMMGWYLDGRVSAVIGTHTHIPTADERLLAGGTAYQTDAGMTGPYDSVIGVDKEVIRQRFLTSLPMRMEAAKAKAELHGVLIDVDEMTGMARSITRIAIQEP